MSLRPLSILLLLAACTVRPLDSGASATDASSGDVSATTTSSPTTSTASTTALPTTTGPVLTTGAPPTATDTGDVASTTESDFITPPDFSGGGKECDTWTEDCPEGQKCMPYSGDGDNSWESLQCVDIVPNPAGPGEPCTAGPIDTGEDTCDKHAMCWDVDPATRMGTCVAMCVGSPDFPDCADPDAGNCLIAGDGVLNLCLPQCDPLAQDCGFDRACLTYGTTFECSPNFGDQAQLFEPCVFVEDCAPGLSCALPELAVECDPMASGCCLPFCDTDDPNTCPGQGQACVPWYDDPADAASFNTDVGLCRLPMP